MSRPVTIAEASIRHLHSHVLRHILLVRTRVADLRDVRPVGYGTAKAFSNAVANSSQNRPIGLVGIPQEGAKVLQFIFRHMAEWRYIAAST